MICTRVGGAECTDLLQALWLFLPQSCMSYLSMSYWQTTGKKMQDVSLSHVLQQQLPTVGSIRRHEAVPQHRKVVFLHVLVEKCSLKCLQTCVVNGWMLTYVWTHEHTSAWMWLMKPEAVALSVRPAPLGWCMVDLQQLYHWCIKPCALLFTVFIALWDFSLV